MKLKSHVKKDKRYASHAFGTHFSYAQPITLRIQDMVKREDENRKSLQKELHVYKNTFKRVGTRSYCVILKFPLVLLINHH